MTGVREARLSASVQIARCHANPVTRIDLLVGGTVRVHAEKCNIRSKRKSEKE